MKLFGWPFLFFNMELLDVSQSRLRWSGLDQFERVKPQRVDSWEDDQRQTFHCKLLKEIND